MQHDGQGLLIQELLPLVTYGTGCVVILLLKHSPLAELLHPVLDDIPHDDTQ